MERAKKINEAVKRMKALGLFENIIKEFEKNQTLEYSEPTPLGGILYWVHNNPEWSEKIKEFELEYNVLVYHAIHNYTKFGELLTLLYVSNEEENWKYDNEDIKEGYPMAYVLNLDCPEFSEFGAIGVKEIAGGLIRTA